MFGHLANIIQCERKGCTVTTSYRRWGDWLWWRTLSPSVHTQQWFFVFFFVCLYPLQQSIDFILGMISQILICTLWPIPDVAVPPGPSFTAWIQKALPTYNISLLHYGNNEASRCIPTLFFLFSFFYRTTDKISRHLCLFHMQMQFVLKLCKSNLLLTLLIYEPLTCRQRSCRRFWVWSSFLGLVGIWRFGFLWHCGDKWLSIYCKVLKMEATPVLFCFFPLLSVFYCKSSLETRWSSCYKRTLKLLHFMLRKVVTLLKYQSK